MTQATSNKQHISDKQHRYLLSLVAGVTLIELLMTLIIGAIAMMALAIPFVADRAFWGSGKAQAESQRDGQMGMRAMAFVAHESKDFEITSLGVNSTQLKFVNPVSGAGSCFKGGPNFNGGELSLYDESCIGAGGAATAILIDGNRSNVEEFTATEVVPNKLVRVRLVVSHQPIVGGPRQEDEVLETEIFLRNGT